ncbi:hypothetical protein [Orientia tsutsugamushi]|uniref:Uncharacterized protein n=1 Tax=Orientia tsutsugamushi str. TA716 TaxID=1359175 RepID=A0A0F3P9A4_ORITS|nr:hypothetical protein [Orientia tsutsugamushi]KJV76542.1 hypothetical protein OTSTA716_0727 [Orientia tsutsugamushi str. TA716]SPR13574.1 integrase [Orientia tsutsugamushi]
MRWENIRLEEGKYIPYIKNGQAQTVPLVNLLPLQIKLHNKMISQRKIGRSRNMQKRVLLVPEYYLDIEDFILK